MKIEDKKNTMEHNSKKAQVGFVRLKSYIGTKKECPKSTISKSPITIQ